MSELNDGETGESSNDAATDSPPTGRVSQILGQIDMMESRRGFMANTAKIGAGAVVLGAAGSNTVAGGHEDEPFSDSPYEDENPNGYGALNDIQIIKFALLLERLEFNFYREAVGTASVDYADREGVVDLVVNLVGDREEDDGGRLSARNIENSESARQFAAGSNLRDSTFEYFQVIRDHERVHVDALEAVLDEVGSDPDFASDLTFTFPYDDADEFVDLAQTLEDTGAGAYTGAAPAIDTEEYLASAAQILAVEARHASYLRVLKPTERDGEPLPFADSFQPPLSVDAVAGGAAQFIDQLDGADEVKNQL